MNISDNLTNILVGLPKNITLIAVSKTQSENDILMFIMQVIKFLEKIKFKK